MRNDPAGLAALIGYQLHLTTLLATREARAALSSRGITPAKVTALAYVRDNPGCDQSTLGRLLDINRSSAMKLINALESRSLIERRSGKDRRSNGLHLTDAGQGALTEAIAGLAASEAAWAGDLTAAEGEELLRLLRKIQSSAEPGRLAGRTAA